MERMSELRLRSSQPGLSISRLAETDNQEAVDALEADYRSQLRVATRRAASIPDPVRRSQAGAYIETLAAAGWPDGNICSLQRRLLRVRAELAAVSEDNAQLARKPGQIVQHLAESAGTAPAPARSSTRTL